MNIKIAIKHDIAEISNVSKLVRYMCVLVGEGDHPSLNKIELAVVELLNNIIAYSKGAPSDSLIELNCKFSDFQLIVSVSDRGGEIPMEIAKEYAQNNIEMPSLDVSFAALPESGWGIQLIKSACDEITYKRANDRNVYKMSFDLSPEMV